MSGGYIGTTLLQASLQASFMPPSCNSSRLVFLHDSSHNNTPKLLLFLFLPLSPSPQRHPTRPPTHHLLPTTSISLATRLSIHLMPIYQRRRTQRQPMLLPLHRRHQPRQMRALHRPSRRHLHRRRTPPPHTPHINNRRRPQIDCAFDCAAGAERRSAEGVHTLRWARALWRWRSRIRSSAMN
jgi:hypothetical protein